MCDIFEGGRCRGRGPQRAVPLPGQRAAAQPASARPHPLPGAPVLQLLSESYQSLYGTHSLSLSLYHYVSIFITISHYVKLTSRHMDIRRDSVGNLSRTGRPRHASHAYLRKLWYTKAHQDAMKTVPDDQDEDGSAYIAYSSEDNRVMHIAALSDDYLRVQPSYVRVLVNRKREAPALFKYASA